MTKISIIVPTKNSGRTLPACLESIKQQTSADIELIVVDNSSTDDTQAIARTYTEQVFTKGPERSAQRNYGVSKATGELVMIIDSDMELGPQVAAQCIDEFKRQPHLTGLVIPEESFGHGFWARCKQLERSFYVGVPWIEAARCFPTSVYRQLGGYDENMVSGEDWDLSQRAEALGKLGRIQEFIRHNEGELKLSTSLKKKYYYAKQFSAYSAKNSGSSNMGAQTGPLTRYKLFFSRPGQLFKQPHVGLGMLFMKTAEFGVGAVGLVVGRGK